MKRLALTTALLAGLAAPALASDQLALGLGVEPGAYTTAELIDLRQAREDQDEARIDFILSGQSSADAARLNVSGIEAAAARAEEEGDYRQAAYLRGRIEDGAVSMSSRGVADAPSGAAATVASAGIDTNGLTAGEVVVLSRAIEEGDQNRVFGLLSRFDR